MLKKIIKSQKKIVARKSPPVLIIQVSNTCVGPLFFQEKTTTTIGEEKKGERKTIQILSYHVAIEMAQDEK